jgi:hypothetical protein
MTDDRAELSRRAQKAIAESRELLAQYRSAVNLITQMMVGLRSSRNAFLEMKADCRRAAFH